jgi:hypothetical protein
VDQKKWDLIDYIGNKPSISEPKANLSPTDQVVGEATQLPSYIPDSRAIAMKALGDTYSGDVATITSTWESIKLQYTDQTAGMSIPSKSDIGDVQLSAAYIKGDGIGSTIEAVTYWRALEISNGSILPTTNYKYDIGNVQKLDFMDMVWAEVKIRLCEWLAGKVKFVPGLSEWLREEGDKARANSAQTQLGQDTNGGPLNLVGAINAVRDASAKPGDYNTASTAAYHGKNVVDYVRKYISTPRPMPFNPTALEIKPILDTHAKSFAGTLNIYDNVTGRKELSKWLAEDTEAIGKWAGSELSEVGTRFRHLDMVAGDTYKILVSNYKDMLIGAHSTLANYIASQDLACCLLSNLAGIGALEDRMRVLKSIRLVLSYAYNGLNINIGSMFDSLVDILNQLISYAAGKLIGTLMGVMDDQIGRIGSFLEAHEGNDTWKRCLPFDELIQLTLRTLKDIEVDITSYLGDWCNTWKLSTVRTNDYLVLSSKREYLRKILGLADMIERGLHTGLICSETTEPGYSKPTPKDATAVVAMVRRGDITAGEATKYGVTPITGIPIIVDELNPTSPPTSNETEKRWIQDCSLALGDDEWDILKAEFDRWLS